jgi:membrane protease YdiL (CAAX protease family)
MPAWSAFLIKVVGFKKALPLSLAGPEGTGSSAVLIVIFVLTMVPVAPLWEEAFFRGWLWTGLRRRLSWAGTVAVTTVPWMLLHAQPDAPYQGLFLLPLGVGVIMARQCCGSVCAAMIFHGFNNLLASFPLLVALR